MRGALLIVILASSILGCAYGVVAGGQIRPSVFDSVLYRTVAARQIPLDVPVDARVVSQREMHDVFASALDAHWAEEDLSRYERALVAMGIWPGDRDLRNEYLAVMSDEVAGVYVPAEEALYVVEDVRKPLSVRVLSSILRRDLMLEAVLSHEIVHLLQHRAYPELLDPALQRRDQDDLDYAIQSALEGDATRYGLEAMGIRASSVAPEKLKKQIEKEMESSKGGALVDAPALIRFTLGYPYVEGYRLSYWEGTELLVSPPASTEQALHSNRRHEPFWVFDLRDVVPALPPSCSFEHSNTIGELQMSVLFRDLGDGLEPAAWEGWDGDRFLVAECAGALEFVWLTAWDTDRDAREFEVAYGEIAARAAARAGLATSPTARRSNREVVVTTAGLDGLASELSSLARRRRVSKVEELREHFSMEAPPQVRLRVRDTLSDCVPIAWRGRVHARTWTGIP